VTNSEPTPPKPGASLAPGDQLGPYKIVELLGSGGMGEVYRATDPRLRRDVALKVLRSAPHGEQLARFSREARAASSLNHPNIVGVYDVNTEVDVPYIVTEPSRARRCAPSWIAAPSRTARPSSTGSRSHRRWMRRMAKASGTVT